MHCSGRRPVKSQAESLESQEKQKTAEKDALKMHKTRKPQVFESLRIRLLVS